MADLYANENFPMQAVRELRRLGHDVLTSHETGNSNMAVPDEDVLRFAGISRPRIGNIVREGCQPHGVVTARRQHRGGSMPVCFRPSFGELSVREVAQPLCGLGNAGASSPRLGSAKAGPQPWARVKAPLGLASMRGGVEKPHPALVWGGSARFASRVPANDEKLGCAPNFQSSRLIACQIRSRA